MAEKKNQKKPDDTLTYKDICYLKRDCLKFVVEGGSAANIRNPIPLATTYLNFVLGETEAVIPEAIGSENPENKEEIDALTKKIEEKKKLQREKKERQAQASEEKVASPFPEREGRKQVMIG